MCICGACRAHARACVHILLIFFSRKVLFLRHRIKRQEHGTIYSEIAH